jgi:hypothetical protein
MPSDPERLLARIAKKKEEHRVASAKYGAARLQLCMANKACERARNAEWRAYQALYAATVAVQEVTDAE